MLLSDKALHLIQSPSTLVLLLGFTIDVGFKSREAFDASTVANWAVLSAINAGDHNVILVLDGSTQLLPGRSHALAVAAPWGKKFNEVELQRKWRKKISCLEIQVSLRLQDDAA